MLAWSTSFKCNCSHAKLASRSYLILQVYPSIPLLCISFFILYLLMPLLLISSRLNPPLQLTQQRALLNSSSITVNVTGNRESEGGIVSKELPFSCVALIPPRKWWHQQIQLFPFLRMSLLNLNLLPQDGICIREFCRDFLLFGIDFCTLFISSCVYFFPSVFLFGSHFLAASSVLVLVFVVPASLALSLLSLWQLLFLFMIFMLTMIYWTAMPCRLCAVLIWICY